MKLTLDDLKVESYSTQVSESELTEVKGGTTWACTVGPAIELIKILVEADNDHAECGSTTTTTTSTNPDGSTTTTTTTTHNCKE